MMLVLALALLARFGSSLSALQKDPSMCDNSYNAHHSIVPPLDKAQVYWNFGGSTVATRKVMRLTPNTQDRQGWLWNEYPIESEHWEVEFEFQVYSSPHFGGDGFGFWVLSADQDPAFSSEPDYLNGPIFGMKEDFAGFGVMFDVYDNDNKRNNPTIFVLENAKGETRFNHDNDYDDDMVKRIPPVVVGNAGQNPDQMMYKSHRCVADFRNVGKGTKAMVKFLHNILHVYIDTNEGSGYKFCLAVQMNNTYIDHHFAFSAATGQVADTHDVKSFKACYLDPLIKDPDDSMFEHFDADKRPAATWASWFFSLTTLCLLGLSGVTAWQLNALRTLGSARIDLVRVCKALNDTTVALWTTHVIVVFLLLCLLQWWPLILNLPLLGLRIYLLASNQVRFNEASISGEGQKGHSADDFSAKVRLIINLVLYGVVALFCVQRILRS